MKKLLNTLYVTSENSYLGLDGENIVVFEEDKEKGRLPLHNLEGIVSFGYRGVSPALDGSLCRKKYLSLFYDAPGKISCEDNRKDKRKCAFARTAVCKQFGFSNQPGNCKKLYTWKGV